MEIGWIYWFQAKSHQTEILEREREIWYCCYATKFHTKNFTSKSHLKFHTKIPPNKKREIKYFCSASKFVLSFQSWSMQQYEIIVHAASWHSQFLNMVGVLVTIIVAVYFHTNTHHHGIILMTTKCEIPIK